MGERMGSCTCWMTASKQAAGGSLCMEDVAMDALHLAPLH